MEIQADMKVDSIDQKEKRSYMQLILKRFLKHKLAVVGVVALSLIVIMAIFAPLLAPYNPYEVTDTFEAKPSMEHWLGTDQIGRDVLSRLIYASRVSIIVGIGAVSIYILIGTIVGAISGYFGGWIDMIIMRITDVFMSFPFFMIILVVVSIVGSSLTNIIIILGILGWPPVARLVRGSILSLKEQDYVKAGVALGYKTPRILFSHLLPNAFAPILVNATFGMAGAIMTEAALSFLGMGVQAPMASWGNMLTASQSLTVLTDQPWLWLPPGIMILISILSINFIGDGLRDALDPKTLNK